MPGGSLTRLAMLYDVLHATMLAAAALAANAVVMKRVPAASLVRIGRAWTQRAAIQTLKHPPRPLTASRRREWLPPAGRQLNEEQPCLSPRSPDRPPNDPVRRAILRVTVLGVVSPLADGDAMRELIEQIGAQVDELAPRGDVARRFDARCADDRQQTQLRERLAEGDEYGHVLVEVTTPTRRRSASPPTPTSCPGPTSPAPSAPNSKRPRGGSDGSLAHGT